MILSPLVKQRFFDSNGLPLAGGQLFSYIAGTSTPLVTYSNQSGTTNTNPVVLDSYGYADVWIDPTKSYKFILEDSSNNILWTVDNVSGFTAQNANLFYAGPVSGSAAAPAFRALASADFGVGVVHSAGLMNLGLAASVASSLLTVRLKQNDGATDPAAGTGAVLLAFRDSTLASGDFLLRSVTSALSMNTVATGATLGLVSAQNQYIYVYAIDNAGTVELALAGSMTFDEGTRYSTTAMSSGATDAQTLYSANSRSNVAIRLIGRLKVNEVTSGTFASAPTELSLHPFKKAGPRSEVWVSNANGYGGTNLNVRRWTTTQKAIGTAITYADSSSLGGSFTINEDGVYSITISDGASGATSTFGATRNGTALSTNVSTLTAAQGFLGRVVSVSAGVGLWHNTLNLVAGDIIREQTDVDCNFTGLTETTFRIVKVSD